MCPTYRVYLQEPDIVTLLRVRVLKVRVADCCFFFKYIKHRENVNMSLNLNLSDVKIFDIVTLLWLSKSICFWHSEFQFTNVQTHHVPFRRRCSTHMTVPNHFWARKQSCEKLLFIFFKVSKSVHHHSTIQINQPTRCNNFSVYYPDVYLQLNMFRAFSRPSSGAQWLRWQSLVLPSYLGDSRAVLVVGPTGHCNHWADRPDHEHSTTITKIWRYV